MPTLRLSCALALFFGACGGDANNTAPSDGAPTGDGGEMQSAPDAGGDPAPDGGMGPAPEESCFEANVPFDAKSATRFAKVDPAVVNSLFPIDDRLFLQSSDGLFEIEPGKDPMLVLEDPPGAPHLVGTTWYFIDRTTASRMDADTQDATPTVIRTDLVDLPYLRVVGDEAVYQQLETGIQVYPLDGSPAFTLTGPSQIDGGVEHAGLFYYFDHDAERPFRVEPRPGAVPEVLSAGDDTFGDFGGGIATNGKYVVWEVGSGGLKGAPIGEPNEVSYVAWVPTQRSFNDGVYDLTFVGDRLYFRFDRTEDDPSGGNRTFTNVGYATPASTACGVVVSDLWAFDGTYDFMLSESTLWIVSSADGSVYTHALRAAPSRFVSERARCGAFCSGGVSATLKARG